MIVPVVILTFLAFIQATLLTWEVVMIVLILRSFLLSGVVNYYLAFALGLLLSLLLGYPLGSLSLLYLGIVAVVYFFKKARFASHWLAMVVMSAILLLAYHLALNFLLSVSFRWSSYLVEAVLIVPAYLAVRLLEEKFVPATQMKLKVGQ